MQLSNEADGVDYVPIEIKPVGYSFIAVVEKIAPGIIHDPKNENAPKQIEECVYFTERNPETGEIFHTYYAAKVLLSKIKAGLETGIYMPNKTVIKVVFTGWRTNHAKTYDYAEFQIFRGK